MCSAQAHDIGQSAIGMQGLTSSKVQLKCKAWLLRGYMYRTKHRNGICWITLFRNVSLVEIIVQRTSKCTVWCLLFRVHLCYCWSVWLRSFTPWGHACVHVWCQERFVVLYYVWQEGTMVMVIFRSFWLSISVCLITFSIRGSCWHLSFWVWGQ